MLRGASKDILNEVERNLQDAMHVARNVLSKPRLVAGGGAAEMAAATQLTRQASGIKGVQQWPYRALAQALEVIPRTLAQNCGASTIRTLTALRAKHSTGEGGRGRVLEGKSVCVCVRLEGFSYIESGLELSCVLETPIGAIGWLNV